ncbi:MAG: 50S ribosomal protein L5, partial [Polyangiaceae bacterium]|nr:50S ribosomal protein L5 [Polyangiaceae bacterium]
MADKKDKAAKDKDAKAKDKDKPKPQQAKPAQGQQQAKQQGGKGKDKDAKAKGKGAEAEAAGGEQAKLDPNYVPRLRTHYRSSVVPALTKKFSYKNPMMVPRLTKVVINMGLGAAVQNPKIIDSAV